MLNENNICVLPNIHTFILLKNCFNLGCFYSPMILLLYSFLPSLYLLVFFLFSFFSSIITSSINFGIYCYIKNNQ